MEKRTRKQSLIRIKAGWAVFGGVWGVGGGEEDKVIFHGKQPACLTNNDIQTPSV